MATTPQDSVYLPRSTAAPEAEEWPAITPDAEQGVYAQYKRAVDLGFAAVLLVLLAPLMLLIAILIKLDSRGPVLFAQSRVGCRRQRRQGRVTYALRGFTIYKFRSMRAQADQRVHEENVRRFVQSEEAARPATFKPQDDPRLTRLGALLRRTSLDELPQLFNVLKGEMSLVGPRPVPAYEIALYPAAYYQRFTTLPGITGLWQVRGRSRLTFAEMMALDLHYVRHISLRLDLRILCETLPAVVSGRGAS